MLLLRVKSSPARNLPSLRRSGAVDRTCVRELRNLLAIGITVYVLLITVNLIY